MARINGFALGGGFEMVLGSDIVVACGEASCGLPGALVGRMPLDGGMTLLQRQIPFRKAMAMMLTGKRITAAEALALGLINEAVPHAELDAAVARWVNDILACAPLSVQAIKQVVRNTSTMSATQAQAVRLPALVAALNSSDSRGARTFYIHPDECISCGICVSVCPPEAIHEDIEIPGHLQHFIAINREFFEPLVSGLGRPGGADGMASNQIDHPLVKATLRAVGQDVASPVGKP